MNKLIVSPSPHVRSSQATWNIMLDVIIALLPASVASVYFFGARSLAVIAVCVACAVISELVFELACRRPLTVSDLSAVVTGLLLALNLPVSIPLWVAGLGSIIAIVAVKQLFGGIGKNFANPAIVARIVLLLSFSGYMTSWVVPNGVDAASSATPLVVEATARPSLIDMLLGRHGGSLGETCAIALIVGGIYLIARRVITWHTPFAYIGTVFAFAGILRLTGVDVDPAYQILAGGVMIGAFFMATDYSSSPATSWGKVIFGIGCGLITVLIRVYGSYPEGVSFAILFMNILTPYISKWTCKKPFGGVVAK